MPHVYITYIIYIYLYIFLQLIYYNFYNFYHYFHLHPETLNLEFGVQRVVALMEEVEVMMERTGGSSLGKPTVDGCGCCVSGMVEICKNPLNIKINPY